MKEIVQFHVLFRNIIIDSLEPHVGLPTSRTALVETQLGDQNVDWDSPLGIEPRYYCSCEMFN